MNFSISTYKEERQYVYDLFKDKSWVKIGNHVPEINARITFLKAICNMSSW